MILLKVLLVLLVLYLILARTSKYWLPHVINRMMKNMVNNMSQGNFSDNNGQDNDVILKKGQQKKKRFDKNEGDYIDFEEIDD